MAPKPRLAISLLREERFLAEGKADSTGPFALARRQWAAGKPKKARKDALDQ
jgi:hypothetical protein